ELGRNLVSARPGLEALLVGGAFLHQVLAAWKALGVAPHPGEPGRCLVDEIAEVVLPAAVVVAEEQQAPFVVDERPSREVDRGDAAQVTLIELIASQEIDHPQDSLEHPTAKKTWLEVHYVGELVLHLEVFALRQR